MNRRQSNRGCGSTFLGCFSAGILLLVVIGAGLYFVAPRVLKDADVKVLPWLKSKGRVLLGTFALRPLILTLEHSELSRAEQKEWKAFLVEKWELAHSARDQKLRREVLESECKTGIGLAYFRDR